MNLALNSWFSQCYNTRILTAKLSLHYFTNLLHNLRFKIEQKQDLLQTIGLFISAWDGMRCDCLRQQLSTYVIWSICAGDCGELSCTHLNREWKFHTKSHEYKATFAVFTFYNQRADSVDETRFRQCTQKVCPCSCHGNKQWKRLAVSNSTVYEW